MQRRVTPAGAVGIYPEHSPVHIRIAVLGCSIDKAIGYENRALRVRSFRGYAGVTMQHLIVCAIRSDFEYGTAVIRAAVPGCAIQKAVGGDKKGRLRQGAVAATAKSVQHLIIVRRSRVRRRRSAYSEHGAETGDTAAPGDRATV